MGDAPNKITQDELAEIFGRTMPWEAFDVLKREIGPDEARKELRRLAAKRDAALGHAAIDDRTIRSCVTWLHQRANEMNDPHARNVLNSAAFDLGNKLGLLADGAPARQEPNASAKQDAQQ